MDLVLLAGPFVGFCHLDHVVIFKLLLLGIVKKLPNLKMSSSMIKKVYLRDSWSSWGNWHLLIRSLMYMSNSAVVWFLSCLMSDRYSSLACQ